MKKPRLYPHRWFFLNRRPAHYECAALPPEPYQRVFLLFLFSCGNLAALPSETLSPGYPWSGCRALCFFLSSAFLHLALRAESLIVQLSHSILQKVFKYAGVAIIKKHLQKQVLFWSWRSDLNRRPADTSLIKQKNTLLDQKKHLLCKCFLELIVGLEPTTCALRMRCSTN